ncbi:MAG: hypothetical protein ACI9EV_001303 [Urechidicola sp.]|jgi:hypothetical protein
MKKAVQILSMFLVIATIETNAQEIPNGGFEEWEIPNTWTETPVGWPTENGQLIQNTVKDSFPNSGDWAMRVYPIPIGVGEYGHAYTDIDISNSPSVLEFHAKWEKTATAAVGVEMLFMFNEAIVFNENWFPTTNTSEWVPISIPVSLVGTEVNHVLIRVFVSIGDFAAGQGWISVDDMQFTEPNGIDELNSTNLFLGPNPCDSEIRINSDKYDQTTKMIVYDNLGHIIHIGNMTSPFDTSKLPNGMYTLQIGEGEDLVKERFEVIH